MPSLSESRPLPTDAAKEQLQALLEHVPMPRILATALAVLCVWGVAGATLGIVFALDHNNTAGAFLSLVGGVALLGLAMWAGFDVYRSRIFTQGVTAVSEGLARFIREYGGGPLHDADIPVLLGEAADALARVGSARDELIVIELSRPFIEDQATSAAELPDLTLGLSDDPNGRRQAESG